MWKSHRNTNEMRNTRAGRSDGSAHECTKRHIKNSKRHLSPQWLRGWFCCIDSLLIVTPTMGFCKCSMFCCALLYVHSSFAILLMGKRELVALLSWSSWCLMIGVWLFLTVPWVCLQFVNVVLVFPDCARLLFSINPYKHFVLFSETKANSADLDQPLQNTAPDQALYCFFTEWCMNF